jgi:signal peptidase I
MIPFEKTFKCSSVALCLMTKGKKAVKKGPTKVAKKDSSPAIQEKNPVLYWLKRTWHFIWYEDSLASWIVNIILAFVLIKFLLYPGLGLLLGTEFPVVAVVSGSMEHHPSNFDDWWVQNEDFYLSMNITKFDFMTYPFKNGFNKGDIMVLGGINPYALEKGEILVYWSRKPYPIIHRFVGERLEGNDIYLMTKGDNGLTNPTFVVSADLNEIRIHPDDAIGKAVLRIPYLGWVKILAVNIFSCTVHGPGDEQGFGQCLIDGPRFNFASPRN